MSAVLAASKSGREETVAATSPVYTIDLGENQRKMVSALIEARAMQRQQKSVSETNSLFSRASILFGKSGQHTNIAEIVDRSVNLTTLRRTGFVPEDFIQSGPDMTFKRLTNAYCLADLLKFGFTFEHFCQLGFDTDDLRNFQPNDYRLMGLTAPEILERVPLTGEELISFKLEPHFLRELRFTFSHFCDDMGMTSDQLMELMPERDLKMYFNASKADLQALATRMKATAVTPKGSYPSSAPTERGPTGSRFLHTSVPGKLTF